MSSGGTWTSSKKTETMYFGQTDFDPRTPLAIVRAEIDPAKINESELGVLSSPTAATATVNVIHPNFEMICESRLLAIYSKFFRRHLGRYPSPPCVAVPENVSADGLVDALNFVVYGQANVSAVNLNNLLCAATRLEISQLQRRLEQYLRVTSTLDGSYFLTCWSICHRAPASVQLRDEMMRRAAECFVDLYGHPEWPRLNDHLVRRLFLRPDLKAPSAIVFEAALTWIAGNPGVEPTAADRIVSAVPFQRMSTIDRLQCLEKARRMQLTNLVGPRVSLMDWHQTCHDFGLHQESDIWPVFKNGMINEKRSETSRPSAGVYVGRYQVSSSIADQTGSTVETRTVTETGTQSSRFLVAEEKQKSGRQLLLVYGSSPNVIASSVVPKKEDSVSSFSVSVQKSSNETPPMIPGMGRPIRFTSSTSIKKFRDAVKSEMSPSDKEAPGRSIVPRLEDNQYRPSVIPMGKPIRFESRVWVKKFRSVKGSKESESGKSTRTVETRTSVKPVTEEKRVSVATVTEEKEIFGSMGKPIRFTSATSMKTSRGEMSRKTTSRSQSRSESSSQEEPTRRSVASFAEEPISKITKKPETGAMGRPIRFSSATRITKKRNVPGGTTRTVVYSDVKQIESRVKSKPTPVVTGS